MSASSLKEHGEPLEFTARREGTRPARRRPRGLFPRSIRGTLVLLLLIMLLPVLFVEAGIYYNRFDERRTRELQSNLDLARSITATFDGYIRDILNHELALGLSFASPEALPREGMSRLLTVGARELPAVRDYEWVSSQGQVIASSRPELVGSDISSSPYFREISGGQEWTVTDLYVEGANDRPIFAVARGMRDASGALQGIVVAAMAPQRLGEIFMVEPSRRVGIDILDRHGRLVYHYPEVELVKEQPAWTEMVSPFGNPVVGVEAASILVSSIDGQKRLVGQSTIRSIGWTGTASRLEAEVMVPVVQDLLRNLGFFLLIAATAGLVAVVIGRNVTAPVRRLQEQVVALGHGKYDRTVEIAGVSELVELAEAFNRMSEEIRIREDQREEYLAERKRVAEALEKSRDFYLTLFDEFPALIWRSGSDSQCNYFNKGWLVFRGRTIEQEAGDGWLEGVHVEDRERCVIAYHDAFENRQPFETEFRLLRHDGEYRWIAAVGRPFDGLDGSFAGYIAACFDVTQRREQEERFVYLATHDPLTGLANRRTLEDALRRTVARARRGTPSALLFIDVDNFKLVNDTLGHSEGDRVLIAVARLFEARLRTEDVLSRLGGDEFAVLMEGISAENARIVAERLRAAVEEFHFSINDVSFSLSLSIGLIEIDGEQPPALVLSQADAAMYRAKEQGRNRVVTYRSDEDGVAWLSEANRLVIRLRNAFKEGLFVLYYQPVVRLSNGEIDHYEVLLRLLGEGGEVVSASEFMPAAERFGLMSQVTRWVLQEAIRQMQENAGVCLAVNLSGLDLSDEALLEYIESKLRDAKVEPKRLHLEITETAMIKDRVLAERWIRRLRLLGCKFALDDFGAGFVSFVYLRDLPVDQLKIDGSFIRTLETDLTQRALVQGVQVLAQTQGKETVAEWIESEATLQILKEIGITYGQGYYLGKPSPSLSPSVT